MLSLLAAAWVIALVVTTGLFVTVVAVQAVVAQRTRRTAAPQRVAVPAPRQELDRLPVGARA